MRFRFLSVQQRNFWFLYLEAFLSTFTGIAGAFIGAYAIRLGATNTEIGLVNSLPPLFVILLSIPFGRILQTSSHKKLLTLGGLGLYRAGFMLFALVPFLHLSFLQPTEVFLFLWVLVNIPFQLFNIGNVGLVISIVPNEHRATVFTVRNMVASIVNIGGVFLAGQALIRVQFPGNYQLLFAITGFLAFLSLLTWLSIRFPRAGDSPRPEIKPAPIAPLETPRLSLLGQVKESLTVFRGQPMFVRFVVDTLLMNVALWTVTPLYVLYTVRQLGASEGWIGTAATVAGICSLVGWLVGRRLTKAWGDSLALRRLVMVNGIYPILVGLSPSLPLIMAFGGLNGLLTPGFTLSNYNTWLKILPEDRREDATAIYFMILNFGPFIFPLVGIALAARFGISPTLIGCGLVALLGSASFLFWPVHTPDEVISKP